MGDTRGAVLEALADGPTSGPEVADRLGVSRAAVWKHVEALREAGFTIRSDGEGYELAGVPEFGGRAVQHGLDAPYAIEFHESIDSTNTRARALATEGRADVVVLSDEQTGGRGRLDREWASPSGGIWLSILLRPQVPAMAAPVYTLAGAVATARAARSVGVEARITWPNDVLVGDRKLAGVLTEMEGEADRVSWLIVGVGVNANLDPDSLPTDRPVTSLRSSVGNVDRRAFTHALLEAFHELATDRDAVVPAWRELNATLGRRVRVEMADGTVEGEAVDIEFPGTLIVDTDGGRVEVTAGDCEHLRRSG